VTLMADLLPALIGGSVVIETIFSIPGMGQLGFQSVLDRDYPLIMAIFTLSALLTLAGILAADFLYTIVDPRIAYERHSG
jgi:peptide/nickel transport system permease protein